MFFGQFFFFRDWVFWSHPLCMQKKKKMCSILTSTQEPYKACFWYMIICHAYMSWMYIFEVSSKSEIRNSVCSCTLTWLWSCDYISLGAETAPRREFIKFWINSLKAEGWPLYTLNKSSRKEQGRRIWTCRQHVLEVYAALDFNWTRREAIKVVVMQNKLDKSYKKLGRVGIKVDR